MIVLHTAGLGLVVTLLACSKTPMAGVKEQDPVTETNLRHPEVRSALQKEIGASLPIAAPQDPLQLVEGLGLRVAPGFKVTLYSGPEFANDIYAMTLDSKGRVVVT